MRKLMIGIYPCTQLQLDVFTKAKGEECATIFKKLVALGLQAHESIVSLPHENEEGNRVVHGANMWMREMRNMYFGAAQSLTSYLPDKDGRNYFPYMVLRNIGRRSLPLWMSYLIERNGGNIPETWSNDDCLSDDEVIRRREQNG